MTVTIVMSLFILAAAVTPHCGYPQNWHQSLLAYAQLLVRLETFEKCINFSDYTTNVGVVLDHSLLPVAMHHDATELSVREYHLFDGDKPLIAKVR